MSNLNEVRIILILGNVGYGRSYLMQKLRSVVDKAFSINEVEFIPRNLISNLGEERNKFTWNNILASILRGETPIVVSNGKCIWGDDTESCDLQNYAREMGLNLKFVTFVPEETSELDNEYIELLRNVSVSVHTFPKITSIEQEVDLPELNVVNILRHETTPKLWNIFFSTNNVEPQIPNLPVVETVVEPVVEQEEEQPEELVEEENIEEQVEEDDKEILFPSQKSNKKNRRKNKRQNNKQIVEEQKVQPVIVDKSSSFVSLRDNVLHNVFVCNGDVMPCSPLGNNRKYNGLVYHCYTGDYEPLCSFISVRKVDLLVWSRDNLSMDNIINSVKEDNKNVMINDEEVSINWWSQDVAIQTYQTIPTM